jgi:N-methylhydantoinase A/oxoprolinase/acetone carboxylase beta subunit
MQGLRIGIDVGGTFTHGVLMQAPGVVIRRSLTPTTHSHAMGVAAGIRTVLTELVSGLSEGAVELVAHSTTQATNALLEGDVSPVNRIVCVPPGEGLLLRWALRDRRISTGSGQGVAISQHLLQLDNTRALQQLSGNLDRSRPTAVIQPLAGKQELRELQVRTALQLDPENSVLAADISQVLGINARARTACINASMLPRMLETANYTEQVVQELLPGVPLQVVRSDGGAMSIAEMRRQPILSIMSGPAAGASAALHRSGLSELLFIEVGGTSTDITLVRGGRVRQRNATVGGNRLLVPALDLRTVALGGGSMLSASAKQFGPRSAHIAGLPYLFQAIQQGLDVTGTALWKDSHGHAYRVLTTASGSQLAITMTDQAIAAAVSASKAQAAQLLEQLGIVLNEQQAQVMTDLLQKFAGDAGAAFAQSVRQLCRQIRELVKSHEADAAVLSIVGGGGGAPVLLEAVAAEMKLQGQLIEDHPVISALGAALAVTSVSLSRSTADPRSTDIEELTRQVEQRLASQGAERVSTQYDYDAQRQVLSVTGRGSRPYDQAQQELPPGELADRAAGLLAGAELIWQHADLSFYSAQPSQRERSQGLALHSSGRSLWQGRIRRSEAFGPGELDQALQRLIADETQYTDGGALLPGLSLLAAGRLIPLDQLGSAELLSEVLRWEKLPDNCAGLFLLA